MEIELERDVLLFENKEAQSSQDSGHVLNNVCDLPLKEEPADSVNVGLYYDAEYTNEDNLEDTISKKNEGQSTKCDGLQFSLEKHSDVKQENNWMLNKNINEPNNECMDYSPRNMENFLEFCMEEETPDSYYNVCNDIDYPNDIKDHDSSAVGNILSSFSSEVEVTFGTIPANSDEYEETFAGNVMPTRLRNKVEEIIGSSSQHSDINNAEMCSFPDIHPERHTIFHEDSKNYVCDECGEYFSWKTSLDRHKVIHGVKNYRCEICGKSFPSKTFYDTHSMTHKGMDSYKCDQCEKSFMWKIQLDRHKAIHELKGNKQDESITIKNKTRETRRIGVTYKCSLCGKRFLMKSNLTNHLLLHEFEKGGKHTENNTYPRTSSNDKKKSTKKYQCDNCTKYYVRKGDLKNHLPCDGSIIRSGCNTPFRWAFQNISKSGLDYSKIVFPKNTNLQNINTSAILGTIDHTTLKLSII